MISKRQAKNISKLWSLHSAKRKIQYFSLIILMFLTSLAEMVSIGAVVPFLAVLSAPEAMMQNDAISFGMQFFELQTQNELITLISGIFILAAIMSGIFKYLFIYISTKLAVKAGIELSVKVFEACIKRPYNFHLANNSNDLMLIIFNKCHDVMYGVMLPFSALISSAISALGIIAILSYINAKVIITCFILIITVYGAILIFTSNLVRLNSQNIAKESTRAINYLKVALENICDIIINRSHNHFIQSYYLAVEKVRISQGAVSIIGASPRILIETTGIVLIAGLAIWLTNESGGVAKAIPTLGALALGAQRLLPAFQQIYVSVTSMRSVEVPLEEVMAYITSPGFDGSKGEERPISFCKSIEFKNVCFQHLMASAKSVENLSFSVDVGDFVGIIGPTGSGKSTVLELIMGLLSPTSGQILIDGIPLEKQYLSNWYTKISYVPQNIYFADASIRENIAFGQSKAEIDDAKVMESSEHAQLSEHILKLGSGYEARIGEHGAFFSGGQKQRLGIARALYMASEIIILDEATSALDTETERKVMEQINAIKGDKTIFMVTHRAETLRYCNRVVDLSTGTTISKK